MPLCRKKKTFILINSLKGNIISVQTLVYVNDFFCKKPEKLLILFGPPKCLGF